MVEGDALNLYDCVIDLRENIGRLGRFYYTGCPFTNSFKWFTSSLIALDQIRLGVIITLLLAPLSALLL